MHRLSGFLLRSLRSLNTALKSGHGDYSWCNAYSSSRLQTAIEVRLDPHNNAGGTYSSAGGGGNSRTNTKPPKPDGLQAKTEPASAGLGAEGGGKEERGMAGLSSQANTSNASLIPGIVVKDDTVKGIFTENIQTSGAYSAREEGLKRERGPSYFHSNYATTAAEARTKYSLVDHFSEGATQIGYKSKREFPPADEIPQDNRTVQAQSMGKHISAEEKKQFLVNTLLDLKDSKEVVYGTLDAWVAWEQIFPLPLLKRALVVLEKEEQWHRIVQVIKWMLSKGQGTTMGTYEQLICALEKDNRPEEAHNIWVKKVQYDLQSVPWRFCDLMLSIYYRNNMPERLVKLFKDIESFGRKPPSKSIVRKVVDAYELLGLLEEKNRVLQKYNDLFNGSSTESSRKMRRFSKKGTKEGKRMLTSKAAIDDKSGEASAPLNSGTQD